MSSSERGQVTRSAAEVYEEFFVPALFQEWASRVADIARIQPGQRVLDVACGTGVLARESLSRVGPSGSVTGLDLNEGMLDVAKRKAAEIEWRHGAAEALPFEDNSFDVVVTQFGLMFFENPWQAIREMFRVLRPGGRLAVAVCGSIETFQGYPELAGLLRRLFGDWAGDALQAPFVFGDPSTLMSVFAEAGIADPILTTIKGSAKFPSIQSWLFTEIRGWLLADKLDDAQFDLLLKEAQSVLAPFVTSDGTVALVAPAHIVTANKP
jgi:SAM-dependent methyltransferase